MKTENGIILQPINSKAQTANCSMKIPNEEIPALIEELKKYNL